MPQPPKQQSKLLHEPWSKVSVLKSETPTPTDMMSMEEEDLLESNSHSIPKQQQQQQQQQKESSSSALLPSSSSSTSPKKENNPSSKMSPLGDLPKLAPSSNPLGALPPLSGSSPGASSGLRKSQLAPLKKTPPAAQVAPFNKGEKKQQAKETPGENRNKSEETCEGQVEEEEIDEEIDEFLNSDSKGEISLSDDFTKDETVSNADQSISKADYGEKV